MLISETSERSAQELAKRVHQAVLRLGEFPQSGRMVPGFEESGLREVILPPYRIVYILPADDSVVIARVAHSRQDFRLSVVRPWLGSHDN
jgi:toxin ParE1/3/4